jgi:hypothetical protein
LSQQTEPWRAMEKILSGFLRTLMVQALAG